MEQVKEPLTVPIPATAIHGSKKKKIKKTIEFSSCEARALFIRAWKAVVRIRTGGTKSRGYCVLKKIKEKKTMCEKRNDLR